MIIRYFSDLHLEFISPSKLKALMNRIPSGPKEVCICTGDIGNPTQTNYVNFIQFLSQNFNKVFLIAGNHEFYDHTNMTITEIEQLMVKLCRPFDNISFLTNTYEYYENYCFIGSTLWSQITNTTNVINDIACIQDLTIEKYNRMNRESIDFLRQNIQHNSIIITHHIPSHSLIDPKYKVLPYQPYNQWFYCNLDNLIQKNQHHIKCWIYGHTHAPSEKILYTVPFLCNPIGYPNEKI